MKKSSVVLWAGGGAFVLACALAVRRLEFIRNAQRAPGVVIALNHGGSHPQIRFTSSLGKAVEYPQGGFISGYQVGDAVTVLYSAESPEQGPCLDSAGALWFAPGLLSVLAAILAVAGIQLRRPS